MNELPAKYLEAEAECQRFLDKVSQLRTRFQNDEHFRRYMRITGGPETSAVRRASLDLSRVLSSLRRRDGV